VDLVERMIADYVQLRAEGVKLSNSDLKSVIRIISEDASQSLRGVVTTSKQVVAGKRSLTPKTLNQKLIWRRSKVRSCIRHRAGRNREDVSGCEHGSARN